MSCPRGPRKKSVYPSRRRNRRLAQKRRISRHASFAVSDVNTQDIPIWFFFENFNSDHIQTELPVHMLAEPFSYELTSPETNTKHSELAASHHFSHRPTSEPLFDSDITSSMQSNIQDFFSISSHDSPQEKSLKNEINQLEMLAETRRKAIRNLQQKISKQRKKIRNLETILNKKRSIAEVKNEHEDVNPVYEFTICETTMDTDDDQNETDFSTLHTMNSEVSESSEDETDKVKIEDTELFSSEYLVNIKEEYKDDSYLDDKSVVFETVSNINGDYLKVCPKDEQPGLYDVWAVRNDIKIEESPFEVYDDRITIKTENDDE